MKANIIKDAITSLVPNCSTFGIDENQEIVIWTSSEPQPTKEAINAKALELQAEYDANQYQRDRAAEYPAIEDQLDSLWHAIDQGIDLKLSGFYINNKQVKDTYAKPSS